MSFMQVHTSNLKLWHSVANRACSTLAKGSKIGFIGLGNMGGPMAHNLLKQGHPLVVYDVVPSSAKALGDSGAEIANTPADLASQVDRIITMLPNSNHVLEVYSGKNGILETLKVGTLLLDSSTIDPTVSRQVAALSEKKGAVYLDAPVSGGVNAAKAGTLTFMVGGPEKKFAAAKALLVDVGKNIVYCGAVGSGQAAKICNNMLLAIGMIGTAETMNLGVKMGLDPKLLAQIINTSSGRCWSSELYNPVPGVLPNVPSSNDYQGGFGTALMTKDLGLAQNAATQTASPIPLGALAHQLYRIMTSSGYATKDFSSVYKFLQEAESQRSS